MRTRLLLKPYLNVWVIGGGIGFGLLMLGGAFALAFWSRPEPTPALLSTPVLNIIPAPTQTPVLPTSIPQPSTTPEPTQPPLPPAPVGLVVGAYVQITGTGGDGLRLRSEPGLSGTILMLGAESEVFEVRDGPRSADGYEWWYLVGLYDNTRRGWGVSNYLGVVQKP